MIIRNLTLFELRMDTRLFRKGPNFSILITTKLQNTLA